VIGDRLRWCPTLARAALIVLASARNQSGLNKVRTPTGAVGRLFTLKPVHFVEANMDEPFTPVSRKIVLRILQACALAILTYHIIHDVIIHRNPNAIAVWIFILICFVFNALIRYFKTG
jgi:hypothetical protein